MIDCPQQDEILRLLDGELSANRSTAIEDHVRSCSACQREMAAARRLMGDLGAPLSGHDPAVSVDRLMRRIERGDRVTARPRAIPWFFAFGGAALAAATIVLAVRPAHEGAFEARGGGASPSLRRSVAVRVQRLDPAGGVLRSLEQGQSIPASTPLSASFRNLGKRAARLLLFAVDAKGEIHWLYPAYTSRKQDPEAISLPPSTAERALPESVVLDSASTGPMRFVWIVSDRAHRVSEIESLAPAERNLPALRSKFRDAEIQELVIEVTR